MSSTVKFQRRKANRSAEIVAAAIEEFAEKGFAATRLEAIAARAGISKGGLYLYFPTKEAIFETVVISCAQSTLAEAVDFITSFEGTFSAFVTTFLVTTMAKLSRSRVPAVAKMVIGEAQNFPELAKAWQREIVIPLMAALASRIRRAQEAGEINGGPPEAYAISIMSPILVTLVLRQVFGEAILPTHMLDAILDVHTRTLVRGLDVKPFHLVT